MSDKKEPTDIEVPDAPIADKIEVPSLTDLAKAGFEPQEVEMAKKHGIVKAEEETDGNKTDESGEAGASDADADGSADRRDSDAGESKNEEGDTDGEEKENKKTQKTVDERYRILAEGRSPEAIMEELQEKGIEMSPEQETILIAGLTHNGKTLYWAQKKARARAQKAEAEVIERVKELTEAQAEIAELKKRPVKKADSADDPLDLDGEETVIEDPKKKPLTLEDLDRRDAEKVAKAEEEAKKRTGRAEVIHEALEDQQEKARELYQDFDHSMEMVSEILDRATKGTLKDLYPDSRQHGRVIMKARMLLNAFANADKFTVDQFNAADLAYELGKEHPEYGKKKPNASRSKPGETDVDGNPEDVRRAVNNANRRGSSATLNGGGSRRVALDELTVEQAARLPAAQYAKLPKAVRERLLAG